MSLSLKRTVHRELAEQCGGHRIGAVALLGLGQESPLDLCGAERDVANDPPRREIRDDVHPRHTAGVIGPGMPAEPCVQGVPAAIEQPPVVVLGQWARWLDKGDGISLPRSVCDERVPPTLEWPRPDVRPTPRTRPNPWPGW
jgi:hypothetical protein